MEVLNVAKSKFEFGHFDHFCDNYSGCLFTKLITVHA